MASLHEIAPKYLYTARLTLELYNHSVEHQACLVGAINSTTAHQRMGDIGIRTGKQFDAFNAMFRIRHPKFKDGIADDDFYYLLRLGQANTTGELIGGISCAQRLTQTGVVLPADIGWCLLESGMGRGYATEAAREVLRWLREDLGLHDIVVFPSETNRQSNRVAEKLGFVPGGRIKDLDQPGMWHSLWILPDMEPVQIEDGLSTHMPDELK